MLGLLLVPASAGAAITPTRDAGTVARAIGSSSGASFSAIPPAPSQPAGTGTPSLAGFPTSGSSYGILSTGNVAQADQPNSAPNTGTGNGGGPGPHGDLVFDLVQLKDDFVVPGGANCATFDFRFFSEEYPEFVGSRFNDGFIAELDSSDFNATASGLTAPHNFAFDDAGHVISVNTTGFSAGNAAGTTYDGATPLFRASTPVTPGRHSVYLSVFDESDSSYDSAVFLDNLHTYKATGGCRAGTTTVSPPVAGKSFNAQQVSGKVYFKCRGDKRRQRLDDLASLPVGCLIDTRTGRVRIISAANGASTRTKSSVFWDGQFTVRERRSAHPTTELRLGGKLAACSRASAASRDVQDSRRRKRGRRLWGKGKGRFRTRGRRSAATVRGTTWLVYDRCDGSTYTKDSSGRVTVRDFVRRRTIRLRKGQVYIARPRKR
jgi:hypothetical protein